MMLRAWRRARSLWWSFLGRLSRPWCPHDSMTGDEGPISELGRWPTRWRCDQCGAIIHSDSEAKFRARYRREFLGEWGDAWWKDDPKTVAAARVQAKGRIAQRALWRELVESWAAPLADWLTTRLESMFRK